MGTGTVAWHAYVTSNATARYGELLRRAPLAPSRRLAQQCIEAEALHVEQHAQLHVAQRAAACVHTCAYVLPTIFELLGYVRGFQAGAEGLILVQDVYVDCARRCFVDLLLQAVWQACVFLLIVLVCPLFRFQDLAVNAAGRCNAVRGCSDCMESSHMAGKNRAA